jgi:hypothetical protein
MPEGICLNLHMDSFPFAIQSQVQLTLLPVTKIISIITPAV